MNNGIIDADISSGWLKMNHQIAYNAMKFAMKAHGDQKRKYTGNPYWNHLAEVAGMVSTIHQEQEVIAVAWLHDCLEDCDVTYDDLDQNFGRLIAEGVLALSDLEQGNRAERNQQSRERLCRQDKWIQDIKVCDLISNTSSIVQHDPNFAKVYLAEKRLMLEVLNKADALLLEIAHQMIKGDGRELEMPKRVLFDR